MMDYEIFKDVIEDQIKDYLPDSFKNADILIRRAHTMKYALYSVMRKCHRLWVSNTIMKNTVKRKISRAY